MTIALLLDMSNTRPRLPAVCYIGRRRYFVTLCCDYRRTTFVTPEVTMPVVLQFLRACTERRFAVIAYVLMPDHMHALVEGLDDTSNLESVMHHVKQRTSHEYRKSNRSKLWQPSYVDRVLRHDEGTFDVIRYICDNPVRKRLVSHWEDYPFTGSGIMTLPQLALCARQPRGYEMAPMIGWAPGAGRQALGAGRP